MLHREFDALLTKLDSYFDELQAEAPPAVPPLPAALSPMKPLLPSYPSSPLRSSRFGQARSSALAGAYSPGRSHWSLRSPGRIASMSDSLQPVLQRLERQGLQVRR